MGYIEVNVGEGMARGLFNLSRGKDITFWFNGEELNRLLSLPESEFEEEFELMVKQANMDKDLEQVLDLRDIAEKESLDWIETTSSTSGYPKDLKVALVGFSDFTHAQQVADKYGLDVESFSRRDGWSLWVRNGYRMYEPYYITSETFGDNYHTLNKMSEEDFMEEEVLPVIENSTFLFEQVENLLQEKKEIWEEIEKMEDDEIVVTSYGSYYETVKERTLSFYHDTRHFLIGVI